MTVLAAGTVATVVTGGAAAPLAVGATTAVAGTGTVAGAALGTGAVVAGGVGASAGATAGVTAAIASGPIGWLVLGADTENSGITFDCWKPVLHDESRDPSKGMLLRDVVNDSRIKEIIPIDDKIENKNSYPQFILVNTWDEQFRIEYVNLPSNSIAAHAVLLDSL